MGSGSDASRAEQEEGAPLIARGQLPEVPNAQQQWQPHKCEDCVDGSRAAAGAWWRAPAAALWNNGVACALGSSFCFATAGALVKALHRKIPVFEIVVVRAIVSGLVTSMSCRANGIPVFGQRAPQLLLIARGVIGASAMTCSYEALVRLPLADSTVIFYISPALTALLAWVLLREAFGWMTALGCLASLAGVVLVAQPPALLGSAAVDWSQERLLGTVFGFMGAALASGAYICIRLIGKREHPLTVAMYFHIAALVTSIIPLSVGYPEPAVLPTLGQAALLLGIACGSFGGNLLVNRAFQLEAAAKASAANFTQVIFAYLLGVAFFSDPVTLLGLLGTALIAGGVIVVNIEKLVRQKQAAAAAAAQLPEAGVPLAAARVTTAVGGAQVQQAAAATAGMAALGRSRQRELRSQKAQLRQAAWDPEAQLAASDGHAASPAGQPLGGSAFGGHSADPCPPQAAVVAAAAAGGAGGTEVELGLVQQHARGGS